MALRVGLGDDGQQLARPGLGQLEREAHDAGHAGARHDRHVGGDLFRQSLVHAAADAGILAFRVLAHDDPVEFRTGTLRSGLVMPGRMRVGRTLAYWSNGWQIASRRPQSVMWSGMSGAPTEPNKMASNFLILGAVGRHHDAVLLVVVRAPVEILEVQREFTVALGAGLQNLDAGSDDFRADAVSGNGGNPVSTHGISPMCL